MSTFSKLNHVPNPRVVYLSIYRRQKRRAEIAAQTAARRRCLTSALAILIAVAGLAVSQYTTQQEHQLQQIERW